MFWHLTKQFQSNDSDEDEFFDAVQDLSPLDLERYAQSEIVVSKTKSPNI
jgi:hypothetical protein